MQDAPLVIYAVLSVGLQEGSNLRSVYAFTA